MNTPQPDGGSENDSKALDEAACWQFIGTSGVGRLAIRAEDGVDIFPLNYLAHNQRIYFRSGPGTKILQLTRQPQLAFETDGRTMLARWSVVVRGTARRLSSDAEIAESGIQHLQAWQPGDKLNYFEIQPDQITGRFIRPRD